MIVRNEKSLEALKLGERDIGSVYLGDRLIWQNNAEYITLPYIVSKGTSWADTGLYLDPTIHRVQGSFIVDGWKEGYSGSLYILEGARTYLSDGVKVNIMINKISPTTYQIRRDWGRSASGEYDGVVYEVGKEYSFDFTPEYTQIGDLRIDRVPETTGLCGNTYYIGYVNDPGLPLAYPPPAIRATKRVFSVYTTGEIIGEYIPTLNKVNNTFNYFDKVTEKYLENKGTEPWTAAYEAWVYQMGRPLSYLRSDGNQWINTGYIFKSSNQRKIIRIQNPVNSSSLRVVNGSQVSQNRSPYLGYLNGNIRVGFGSQSASTSPIIFPLLQETTTYSLETFADKTYRFADDNGKEYIGDWSGGVITNKEEYLFRLNLTGDFTSAIGLVAYTAYDDDIKVIDVIPFITWEGVKGYLNLVNRELLLNQGTGEFEVPLVPVYAINWQDETFDPIVGKVAAIGNSSYTSGLTWNDWTDAQKATFKGKKMKVSWKLSAKDVVPSARDLVGFSTSIFYKDGTSTFVSIYSTYSAIFTGLESPYTLAEDYSRAAVIQIQDKEIDNIVNRQPQFYLSKVTSGELKAYDIKWEVDVPEWEIDAIESLNASGIAAFADHQDNINMLNQIGIK